MAVAEVGRAERLPRWKGAASYSSCEDTGGAVRACGPVAARGHGWEARVAGKIEYYVSSQSAAAHQRLQAVSERRAGSNRDRLARPLQQCVFI